MAWGGGSRANAVVKTHRRAIPCVLTGIIDAAASSEQRCHAGPRRFGVVRGGFGLLLTLGFVGLSAPVPFACAEGVRIDGLIDELICYFRPLMDRRFAICRPLHESLVGRRHANEEKATVSRNICIAAGRSAAPAAATLRACQKLNIPDGKTLLWRIRLIRREGVGGAHCVFPYKRLKS